MAWTEWAADIRSRKPKALERWRREKAEAVRARQFAQYLFFAQWAARAEGRARDRGIEIMGDIPIFVAHDSADVWAHPDLFRLEKDGTPEVVAGVPPDYFSATGQLWGNPHLSLGRDGAPAATAGGSTASAPRFELVDRVRLDHFRGFEAYWEIPAGEKTAVNGQWVKGPGAALFEALREALGELPIVAENLGVITPEVEALRERFGFPGMAILQFAWGERCPGLDRSCRTTIRASSSSTPARTTTTRPSGWWTARRR